MQSFALLEAGPVGPLNTRGQNEREPNWITKISKQGDKSRGVLSVFFWNDSNPYEYTLGLTGKAPPHKNNYHLEARGAWEIVRGRKNT